MRNPEEVRLIAKKEYDERASRKTLQGISPTERILFLKGWRYNAEHDNIYCVGCGKALGDCGHKSSFF